MSKIIGIDLGTTNTVAAVIEGGQPVIIPTQEGYRILPSVVALWQGQRLIGQVAQRQPITNPRNTIFSIKRFMGRRYDTPEVQEMLNRIPYRVSRDRRGEVMIQIGDHWYRPQQICAMIF